MHTAKQKLDLNGMGLILYNMASRHIYSRVSKTSDPSLTPVEVHLHEHTPKKGSKDTAPHFLYSVENCTQNKTKTKKW